MTRRKNVKRIDPRYFLHETVARNDDGSRLDEDQELDADIADCEEKHGRSGAHNDLARCRNLAKNAAGVRKAESRGYVDPDLAAERERRALQNPANWQEGLNRAEELEESAGDPSREETRTRKDRQVAAWQKKRAESEAAEAARTAGGGDPSLAIRGRRPIDKKRRADAHAAWKAEQSKTELEEGCPHAEEGAEAIDISAPGTEVHVDDISQLSPEEAFAAGMAAARDAIDQAMGGPDEAPPGGGFSGGGPVAEPAMQEDIKEEGTPSEPDWRGNKAARATARKAKKAAAANNPPEDTPSPAYHGDPYALDHEQRGRASLNRWRQQAARYEE